MGDPTLRPLADDEVEQWGCCALEDGHDGPCEWVCNDCRGAGTCQECGGDDPEGWCHECGGTGQCPAGCTEGRVIEEVPPPQIGAPDG